MFYPLTALVVNDVPDQRQIPGRLLRTLKVSDVIETDDSAHVPDIIQI
jgi:hypothetical protein